MRPKIYLTKEDVINEYVSQSDTVLDVGFWGQGIPMSSPLWPHQIIKNRAKETFGIDTMYDTALFDQNHYKDLSAEDFDFQIKFDRILAFDLIEHLPNPGLFLASCARNLKENGKLVIITPNAFSLFNMTMKLTREEPVTNKDHTCYFNTTTLDQLVTKCGLKVQRYDYLYSVGVVHKESLKKKFLNIVYSVLSKHTGKYCEDFVMIVTK
jgi:2-polyprenyl-3-methyl-5-hydroxy-6-metoxy-1,4-benzoquinol methylase